MSRDYFLVTGDTK